MVLLWLIAGVVLVIAEVLTTTLFLLMFGAGAFAAAVAAGLGAGYFVQAAVFSIVSVLALALARPALRRRLSSRSVATVRSGAEAIEGATALVLEQIDAEHGLVKLDGELWQARSYDASQVIPAGERVRVVEVKGATALVWRD